MNHQEKKATGALKAPVAFYCATIYYEKKLVRWQIAPVAVLRKEEEEEDVSLVSLFFCRHKL